MTLWYSFKEPSLFVKVDYISSSEQGTSRRTILLLLPRNWWTLIVQGLGDMTWKDSKTTTSAYVPTSMASPSMLPRCHHSSLLREMEKCIFVWWLLGGSNAMHEFLVLHHMATDSAEAWDNFLDLCLPHCTWVRAGSRRALALHMFDKYHIAPSHRKLAHPLWVASMKLMLDLLIGARKKRYLCSRPFGNVPAQVYIRGFSAGSYSGICLLHILWSMPHVQL